MDKSCPRPRIQVISSKCAVWSCDNNTKPSDSVTYFNLPTSDKGRCIIWLLNAGRIDLVSLTAQALSGYVFCEKHFEPSQIVSKGLNIRKLTKNAIPTLFGLSANLIPLDLINPTGPVQASSSHIQYKSSSKPSSISASNVKCCKCSKSYKTSSGITLYFFPVDDPCRYFSWIINSGEVNLLQKSKEWVHHNCLLCSDHFETSQFEEDNSGFLRAGAIPTLFRGPYKPPIPAPLRFNKDCRKPFPLVIKSTIQSPVTPQKGPPKISVVNTSSTAKRGRGRPPVPIKINIPEVVPVVLSNSSPVKTSQQNQNSAVMQKENIPKTYSATKKVNVPSVSSAKATIPVLPSPSSIPMKSTILIDATGKPASDHPLASVISTFLAQNKGHTGDMLITDGTPNGIKYLIRQNKPTSTSSPSTTTIDSTKDSGASPSFFVSPQSGVTTGPTIVRSSIKSLSSTESFSSPSFDETVVSDSETTSKATNATTVTTSKASDATSDQKATAANNQASSNASVQKKPTEGGDAITILVPVSSPLQSKPTAPTNVSNSNGDVTFLVPVLPTQTNAVATAPGSGKQPQIQAPLKIQLPAVPSSHVNSVTQKSVATAQGSKNEKVPAKQSPPKSTPASKTAASGEQPFTIVQKNVESIKQNGSTTCKSTFVIRGNGPLSPSQLEAIIKDNLLRTGTIKDGAKILIRHKGGTGAVPSQNTPAVKNEAFVVKKSQILPMSAGTSVLKSTPVGGGVKPTSTTTTSVANPQITNKFALPSAATKRLHQDFPFLKYPKGVSPEKLAELRRIIHKHQSKISRQTKIIERLKREKKEVAKNLSSTQLSKVVKAHLPGFSGTFFASQLHTITKDNKKLHGHRWDDDTKTFALGLWNRSPAAFKLMQRAFKMPSIKTLTKWVSSIPPEIDFFQKLTEVMAKPVEEPKDPFDDLGDLEEPKDDDDDKKTQAATVKESSNQSSTSVVGNVSLNLIVDESRAKMDVGTNEEYTEAREGEVEPEGPHNDTTFPDEEPMDIIEEDPSGVRNEDDRAIIEKVCIDLDNETGMQIVEEIVDSGDVLVEQLIAAAANSGQHVILQA